MASDQSVVVASQSSAQVVGNAFVQQFYHILNSCIDSTKKITNLVVLIPTAPSIQGLPSRSNLLVDNDGNLKLADFGLARSFASDHNGNLTNRVITFWYRPSELLLGATKYGPAVDMWSVGCIFVELLHRKPILPGKNEQ